MAQQPEVSLNDYTERSIVLRSNPPDFFKPYSRFLTQVSGKWNPNLKDPSRQGVLPGWIFPKSKQAQVQQAVQQILSGQIPAQSPVANTLNQPQVQTLTMLSQQPVNTLQNLLSRAQAQSMSQAVPVGSTSPSFITPSVNPLTTAPAIAPLVSLTAQPAANLLAPMEQLPGAAPPGYQQVTYIVIRPEQGQTLSLNVGTTKVPITVQSVQMEKGVVNQALVRTPDGQLTNIRLVNDEWIVPGYQQQHTISLQ